jgi:uncharacterized protein
MMIRGLMLSFCLGLPAHADVAEAVQEVILPGYADFAVATAALSATAGSTCDVAALRPAWNTAFDAWLKVAHVRLGPSEENGRALAIAFWPDPKGLGAKAQVALMMSGGPALTDPAAFGEVSVAARGLFGLERLLYPADPAFEGEAACPLIRATAADLAGMAAALQAGWEGGTAAALMTAGEPGNTTYLSPDEARQALLTALVTGLDFNADQRLGRPMGEFDKPRPERAEARASARSQRNLEQSLAGLEALSAALVPDAPVTLAAFRRAEGLAAELGDPAFAGVADPQGRLKVEILQQSVRAISAAVTTEVVPALGVGLGFNAADGD